MDLNDLIKNGTKLNPGDKVYVNNRDKNLCLFVMGKKPLSEGMNILGAHIDSPRLDLKQKPLYEDHGLVLMDTHYYGGVKKYQWVATPMAIHGVVCKKDGYCSDMTRAFFFRKVADPKHKEIYDTVCKAVAAAEAICKPGVPLWQIDKAARDVITEAGYGEYFQRRTGHFIGLEVHDYGDVSSANQNLTQPGNVFSIEPGITIPGEFGVYVEDLVMITEDGCEILNHYTHDLQIIE